MNNKKSDCLETDDYFQKNWPLYSLINQISSTIYKISQKGTTKTLKITDLPERKQNDLINNTDEICQHILETYILDPENTLNLFDAEKTHSDISWFPALKTKKEIKLHYIIATSDLVSYIFEYKLMTTKAKNEYLKKVKNNVIDIYNKLIQGTVTYDAINSYLNENDKEDITILEYKTHIFCPKIVLIFVISVIQEIVRKTLTQNRNNIFYNILQTKRDKGFDENTISSKVEKDAKSYMLIFRYFGEPGASTIKNKEEKLKRWILELNKLRYGVLDDYLFDLADAAQISFEEKIVTSIKTSKKHQKKMKKDEKR